MPLSDREQKILEEIERNLYADDPGFPRGVERRPKERDVWHQLRSGGIVFALGFVSLIAFFVTRWLPLGVIAFGAMVLGIVVLASAGGGVVAAARRPAWNPRTRITELVHRFEQRLRDRYRRP